MEKSESPSPPEAGPPSPPGPEHRGPSAFARVAKNAGMTAAVAGVLVVGIMIGRAGDRSSSEPGADHETEPAEAPGSAWTCSMHPQIRMEKPGKCPICGMDLVPTKSKEDEHGSSIPTVTLSPAAAALAGVRTSPVVRTTPRSEVRLLGRVDYDETRLRMVTPWTDGRIDRLKVRVTGAKVRKGQVVAFLYSPEVYAAMRDLVVAAKQAEKLSKGLLGSGQLAAAAVSAARERLRLLGISEDEIKNIERTGKAPKLVPIRSSFSGTVVERNVEEGNYVKAGTALFHVVDLSRVWVQIDAYESDLPHLSIGDEVIVEIDSLPHETFTGKIAFIDPIVDKKTRTARVRVEVSNKEGQLRPGMFAQAIVEADIGKASSHLVVPTTAALFTGRRSVVYVAVPEEPGSYALREVRLGTRAGPVFPVLAGLSEGEKVVTHGAFALDADLQLSGGRSMMTLADDRDEGALPIPVTPRVLADLEPVLAAYLRVRSGLAGDDIAAARVTLGELAEATNGVELSAPRATREAWTKIASDLSGHSRHAAMAEDDGEVRKVFELVSNLVIDLLRTFGNPTDTALRVAFCPMAFDNRGAQWVQVEDAVANPYYGSAMLRCGDIKATVLPAERLASPKAETTPPPSAAMAGHQH